ncbi:MAG: hypothetical protein AB8D78_13900 [Akkermansiaceae bacterium]
MKYHILLLILTMVALRAEPSPKLLDLKWMEGTWLHESEGTTVRVTGKWIEGGKFFERNFTIQMGASPEKRLRQTVFWDPSKKLIRSFGVYSDGGLEEAEWEIKDGKIEVKRVLIQPEGLRGKATNHWRLIGEKDCEWYSTKRSMGREKLPDIPETGLEKQ